MKKLSGPIYLFCAFTLAGTSVISARFVSDKLGPFTITAISMIFALLFLLPFCLKKLLKTMKQLTGKDFLYLLLQSVFGMFLFRMFFLNGIRYTSTGEAGILTGATPAITAILAMTLLKESAGRKKLIGILCTVVGIIILQGFLSQVSTFSMNHFWGNMLVLCAAASESLFNIFSRIFAIKAVTVKKYELPPFVQTSIVSVITLSLCVVPAIREQAYQRLAVIGIMEWLALLWYGVVVTALAFLCWYSGIKRCGAITAAAFSGMMPFTAMLLSILVLGEKPDWQKCIGGILIITGMMIIGVSKAIIKTPVSIDRKVNMKVIEESACNK